MNRPGLLLLLALLLPFASACHAVVDTLSCLKYDDEWEQDACHAGQRRDDARQRARVAEAERSAQRDRDQDMQARVEYRAAVGPCGAGDARACFVTAFYEDRHGAPASQVEPRYRFACVAGAIGRACFLAGAHAQTRDLALASFSHGCELRDGESCRAGLDLAPTRSDLVETACAAHYGWACTLLGR